MDAAARFSGSSAARCARCSIWRNLGPRTIWVDCDVLQADGGTRTAAITGASLAVSLACQRLVEEKKIPESPIKKLVAAVSAGVIGDVALLDLDYEEDKAATVDLNLVVTEDGEFVEVQGAGEEATFSQASNCLAMLSLGGKGIAELIAAQRAVLASRPPRRVNMLPRPLGCVRAETAR